MAKAARRATRGQKEGSRLPSAQGLLQAFHTAAFAIGVCRARDGVILDVNQELVRITGYCREELIGRSVTECNLFVDPAAEERATQAHRDPAGGPGVELQIRTKSGEMRDVLVSFARVPLDGEESVVALARDISQRKRAEQELGVLLTLIQEITAVPDFHDALYVLLAKVCEITGWEYGEAWRPQPNGQDLECGPAWYCSRLVSADTFRQATEDLGVLPRDSLPGQAWLSREPVWVEDLSSVPLERFVRASIAAKVGLKAALAVPILADDEVLAVLVFFATRCVPQDTRAMDLILGIGAQVSVILLGKQAEQALRESEERFRLLAEHANDMICLYRVTQPEGFEYVSPSVTTILGYTPQQFYANPAFPSVIVHPDDLEKLRKLIRARATGPVAMRWLHKDGSVIWAEHRNVLIHDESGALVAAQGIVRDITARKRAEEALQQAREELEGRVERQMERGNVYGLTFRELTVLHLVAAGKADKEIALELGISPLTAQKHLSNILGKMKASSRTEAGVRAIREGLIN